MADTAKRFLAVSYDPGDASANRANRKNKEASRVSLGEDKRLHKLSRSLCGVGHLANHGAEFAWLDC